MSLRNGNEKYKNDTIQQEGAAIPPKPPRPYTAYHVFFQLEKTYILQTSGPPSALDLLPLEDVDDNAASRPER